MCALAGEGWLLKEAGVYGDAPQRMIERMKRVLPKKRYCVLFAKRLSYFAESVIKLKNAGDDPGIRVNDFNAVVGVDAGSAAAGKIEMDDVVTELDGVSVVGTSIDWRRERALRGSKKKLTREVKVMRLKGFVPLGRGVEVRICNCVLNRINSSVCAFEIDLADGQLGMRASSTLGEKMKGKYVFICADDFEAKEWKSALMRLCPPSMLSRGGFASQLPNLRAPEVQRAKAAVQGAHNLE